MKEWLLEVTPEKKREERDWAAQRLFGVVFTGASHRIGDSSDSSTVLCKIRQLSFSRTKNL
jgi:hypothetical protein